MANPDNTVARSVRFQQPWDATFFQPITGLGSIVKSGSGRLVLTGTNTYSLGTTVEGGTLQGNTNSLQGDIVNNASVIFAQGFDGTYAGNLAGPGQLTKNDGGLLNLTGRELGRRHGDQWWHPRRQRQADQQCRRQHQRHPRRLRQCRGRYRRPGRHGCRAGQFDRNRVMSAAIS